MAAINKTIMATPTSVRPQWPSQYGQLSNLWSLKHAQLSERPYWPSGYGRLSNCNGHSNMHSYQEGHSGHQDMDSYLTHDQRCTAVCVNKTTVALRTWTEDGGYLPEWTWHLVSLAPQNRPAQDPAARSSEITQPRVTTVRSFHHRTPGFRITEHSFFSWHYSEEMWQNFGLNNITSLVKQQHFGQIASLVK